MTINYQLLGNDPMLAEMGQTVPLNYILKKVTVDSKTTTYWVPKNNEIWMLACIKKSLKN